MRDAFDSCQESRKDQQGLLEGCPLLLQAAIAKFSYRHRGCNVNLLQAYLGECFLLLPQIVPVDLQNILFAAFHTNPIGGHFNTYKTMHRICLCYYWPEMLSYI
jgi:hypothetical protein